MQVLGYTKGWRHQGKNEILPFKVITSFWGLRDFLFWIIFCCFVCFAFSFVCFLEVLKFCPDACWKQLWKSNAFLTTIHHSIVGIFEMRRAAQVAPLERRIEWGVLFSSKKTNRVVSSKMAEIDKSLDDIIEMKL